MNIYKIFLNIFEYYKFCKNSHFLDFLIDLFLVWNVRLMYYEITVFYYQFAYKILIIKKYLIYKWYIDIFIKISFFS